MKDQWTDICDCALWSANCSSKLALAEMTTLDGSLRKVVKNSRGYEANFMGLTEDTAAMACRRLQARKITCYTIGPG